ncbi:MAG: sugar-binding protein, partial [Candidatus Contubernalis sp.]|nr:sugar-binding protein [Candidatus Contubernalis sp.]
MRQNPCRSGLFCTVLLFCFFSVSAFSAEVPRIGQFYPAGYFSKPPVIDGEVAGDPVWDKVLEEKNFLKLGTKETAGKNTSFRVGYDDKNLYFGVICAEPDMDKIKAQPKDSELVWGYDGIEMFVFPSREPDCFQFAVNNAGAHLNLKAGNANSFPLWDWQVKTAKGKNFYSVETKIPFAVLGKKPRKGERWFFNVARNTFTPGSDLYTTWSYLKDRFYEPENFGVVLFTGLPVGRTQAEKILIREQWKETEEFISYYEKRDPVLSREIQSVLREI